MGSVALIVDGVWQTQEIVRDGHHALDVASSTDIVSSADTDVIVSLLAEVVTRAQRLSEADQRRVRDFVHAASSVLAATTILPQSDQTIFEAALRAAVRK